MLNKLQKDIENPERRKVMQTPPATYDYRTEYPNCVKSPRDQGSCGSCWLFAASRIIDQNICRENVELGVDKYDVEISPQFILSCNHQNGGCKGDWPTDVFQHMVSWGIVDDKCFNYHADDNITCPEIQCPDDKSFDFVHDRYYISGYFNTWFRSSDYDTRIDLIKKHVYNVGPIAVAMEVYGDFAAYGGGIYEYTTGSLVGMHAVTIIGWGADYWIGTNSWGTNWGENGYFRAKFKDPKARLEHWVGWGVNVVPCKATCYDKCDQFKSVCNFRGTCSSKDTCTCNEGFCTPEPFVAGHECNVPQCKTKCGYSGSTCSDPECFFDCNNHGTCVSPNKCECEDGWIGEFCTDAVCDTIACGSHGTCVAPNKCGCINDGWTGEACSIESCYGIPKTDPKACNSKGDCTSANVCECTDSNYHGHKCHHLGVAGVSCYKVDSTDPLVCSKNGQCVNEANDICECDEGYDGDKCQYLTHCYGIKPENKSVCSSSGRCTKTDYCVCDAWKQGDLCDQPAGLDVIIIGVSGSIGVILVIAFIVFFGILLYFSFSKKKDTDVMTNLDFDLIEENKDRSK